MPHLPIDFSKNVIYKLVCNNLDVNDCYIGHTTNFTDRKRNHKSNCTNENHNYYHLKVYQTIRANGGWDNWSMVLVEEFPCSSKLEAEKRERYWIETLRATLNCNVPTRTMKEWEQDNAEKIKEQHKIWYLQHVEEIKQKQKEYRLKNSEKKKQKNKEYREKNKQKINEKNRIRYFLKKEQEKQITEIEL